MQVYLKVFESQSALNVVVASRYLFTTGIT